MQNQRTPSDHDWTWAIRRLRRGEEPKAVIEKLTDYRDDKPNPQYYARLTVTRAYATVALARGDDPDQVVKNSQCLSTAAVR